MRMEAIPTHKGKRIYSVDTVSIQCRHCVDTVLVSVQTLYEHFRFSKNSSPKKTHKFYCCTVHYGIYIFFTHQQMHFLLNLEKFTFTWKYT